MPTLEGFMVLALSALLWILICGVSVLRGKIHAEWQEISDDLAQAYTQAKQQAA